MIKLDLSNYTESTWDEYILSLAKDPEFKDDIEFFVPDVRTWRRMLVPAVQYLHTHKPSIRIVVHSPIPLSRFQKDFLSSMMIVA